MSTYTNQTVIKCFIIRKAMKSIEAMINEVFSKIQEGIGTKMLEEILSINKEIEN